jgi:DNA (cytosine-5)-methyltransferase 1
MSKNMKQTSLFLEDISHCSWFSDALKFLNISDDKAGWSDDFGKQLYVNLKNKVTINTLSLFSGGGGLDIAFSDAGFNIVECVEIEKLFVETLEENAKHKPQFSNTKISCIDIRKYKPNLKKIDFIIGGPPCQTFSAGARAAGVKGLDDQRGTLFEEYVNLLKLLQPKGFLFENVYRIVGAQGGKAWKIIQQAFQDAGYKLYWRIIDAADYGVPQHRERLIIVGVKQGEFLFPYPTHGPDSQDNRAYYNAGKAVQGFDTSKYKIGINGRHGHLLNDIPPGLNYSFYTEKFGHPNPVFGWRSKFSDYLYKADPETPVRTIKAQGGQYTGPFSWDNRSFSVEELKRLQTFPDDYILVGNRHVAIMQLGNSVPPQAGRILALSVLDQVFNVELPFNINYMPANMQLGFRKRKSGLTKIYAAKAKAAIDAQLKLGKFENRVDISSQGKITQYLKKTEIVLSDEKAKESIIFDFEFNINKENWNFIVTEANITHQEQYSIKIRLSETHRLILNTNTITLISLSDNPYTLVALWKFLEKQVKQIAHKDDLIQLFGYYQSRQKNSFEFIFENKKLEKIKSWNLVKNITNGIAIGTALHLVEISDIFKMNEIDFIESAKKLKKIGFEIRNHNTNSQLETDYYLIPYQFPTLNERSLQRLTNL